MEQVLNDVTKVAVDAVKNLTEAVESLSEEEKTVMAMSFCGLIVDSTLAEFGFDENKAWEQLVEAHKYVNEQMGDFKA
jgi:hypothetical protein